MMGSDILGIFLFSIFIVVLDFRIFYYRGNVFCVGLFGSRWLCVAIKFFERGLYFRGFGFVF